MFGCGWIWLYVGAFLMLAELMAPGFVVFFFGLSASTVGILRMALGESFGLALQLASFSILTVLYLVVLRRWLRRIFTGDMSRSASDFEHEQVGRAGSVTQALRPHLAGRVMVGDSEWTAVSDAELGVGADVRVVAQDNLTLKVEPL